MDLFFARITKCTFNKFGPFGTVEKHDAQCLLPYNVINEKIAIFLWFYFFIISLIAFGFLVYLVVVMCSHSCRKSMILSSESQKTIKISKEYEFGDFIFLYLISKNLDKTDFEKLMKKLISEQHND